MKTATVFYKKRMLSILFILLLCYPWTGYAADYRGEYGGISKDGIMVTITLGDNGQAMTNIWGIPISAEYKISFGKITLTASVLGTKRTIQGRIEKDEIKFADIVLKKGVTESDLLYKMFNMSNQEDSITKNENVDEIPENDPYAKYDEAERLFSLGHYQEAIALYDEIADEVDVEERRNYAAECLDYCETYFETICRSSVEGLRINKYIGYGMDEVIIPYGVVYISKGAFEGDNAAIESIVIPETVKELPRDSLKGCINLKQINIPPTLKSLALNGTGIRELIIPSSVEEIPDGAFMDCPYLETVIFEGETKIVLESGLFSQYGVFARCKNLRSVILPNSIQSIPARMFEECSWLEKISIPETVASIGDSAFKECFALKEIVLPNELEEIGRYAFEKCVSLQKIAVPEKIKTVPEHCFENCISLNYIKLPNSIENIEEHALGGCSNLRMITIPKKLKSIDKFAFSNVTEENKGITLYVTKGTYGHRYAEENGMNYGFGTEPDLEQGTLRIGSTIYLGEYEQDGNLENGSEPIGWFIIGEEGNEVYLISSFVLDYRPCFESDYVKHVGSAVQKWVQNEFYQKAFTEDEQKIITNIDLPSKDEIQKHVPYEYMLKSMARTYAYRNCLSVLGWDPNDAKWWLRDITPYHERLVVSSAGWYSRDNYGSYGNAAGIRPRLWIDKDRLQQMLTGDTIEITAPEINGNDMTDNIVNKEPATLVANEETEKTSEMTEARLQEQQGNEDSGLITKSGKATGAAGGQVIATVVVENGVILSCSIDDENATEQMREGYDFCMKALEGKTCASVVGESKKKLANDVREYMQEQGHTLTSGGYTHKAIVDGIQAIRAALE